MVVRFDRTILDEFFRVAFRTTFYESLEALQADPDAWLAYCHAKRPHQGYRAIGHRPIDTIDRYLSAVKEEG